MLLYGKLLWEYLRAVKRAHQVIRNCIACVHLIVHFFYISRLLHGW